MPSPIRKVCPIVLCRAGADVLACEHPRAGCQHVQGTIWPCEQPQIPALRELREEAGVKARNAALPTRLDGVRRNEIWWLCLMRCPTLPEVWTHVCVDDGGLALRFFRHWLGRDARRFGRRYREVLDWCAARPRALSR